MKQDLMHKDVNDVNITPEERRSIWQLWRQNLKDWAWYIRENPDWLDLDIQTAVKRHVIAPLREGWHRLRSLAHQKKRREFPESENRLAQLLLFAWGSMPRMGAGLRERFALRRKHNILIGERTAEQMKMQIGCVFPKEEETTIEIKGRCLMTGLPKTITVTSTEMLEAFEEPVERILEAIHGVLERTPPELVADIANNGIVMTGGGSLVDGFDKLITARTGIHTVVAENAISCVAIGTGKSLDSVHEMNDGTVNLSRRKQMN